jgi:hypothetical protein
VLVKNFVARHNKIILAVEYDGDGLALGEHATRTCRVGVDDRRALGADNLDSDHVIVYDINDPEQGRGND